MENLKYSLFDFFSYLLPGILFLLFLSFAFKGIDICADLSEVLVFVSEKGNLYSAILFVFISYVIGFITNLLAKYLSKFKEKWFPPIQGNKVNLYTSQKYILVRQFSKENFVYIEKWNVLRSMTANIALNVLIIFSISPFIFPCTSYIFILFGVLLCTLLLFQSTKYESWVNIELDNAVYMLNKLEIIKNIDTLIDKK